VPAGAAAASTVGVSSGKWINSAVILFFSIK
jgi:hypothetical protein